MKTLLVLAAGLFAALSVFAAEPCPVVPFLAITGRPTEQDAIRKVAKIKEAGFDQFLIYARSGLEYDYMGEDWLRLCEQLCREAERQGMKVWLYDEYNWPSGTCKGRVPAENDAWRYTECAVYRNDDGSYSWKKAMAPHGWVNVCEPAAIKRFIELTHLVYEKRLAHWFANKTIVGIFTDEPGHPTGMHYEGKPVKTFRWHSGLEEEYKAETGRDFRKDVERFLDDQRTDRNAAALGESGRVWEVYSALQGRRFRSAYFDQLRAWCDRVGIVLSGHMIDEDNVRGSCRFNGDPLLALKGESLPGMDEIGSRSRTAEAEWLTLNVAEHAIRRNGRGGLVELYALGPNDMTPAHMRQMIWLVALHGVDHYLVSMEVMDMRGLIEKHGYLSPVAESQPWHGVMRPLLDDARRAARFARKADFDRVAAVRYPQRLAARSASTASPAPCLHALLKAFNSRQVSLDLIAEDETTALPYVFACRADGKSVVEERSGRVFPSVDAATDWVLANATARSRIRENDGTLARDVIVRDYADGSTVVLNLQSFTSRTLWIERDGARHPFALPARGVLALEPGELPTVPKAANTQPVWENDYAISLDRANVRRVTFTPDKTGTLTVGSPLKGVRLVLRDCVRAYAITGWGSPVNDWAGVPPGTKVYRHDAIPYTFEMDGRPLSATQPCTALPHDFQNLYRETDPFDLAPGVHTLRIVTGEVDQNFFLPAAFVAGDFSVFNGVLTPRPSRCPAGPVGNAGLADFTGALTYTATVAPPPRKGLSLRLATGGLFTSVKWNGRDLGVKAWEPYEWSIPESGNGASGKLEITVYPPYVNIFGDPAAPGAKWDLKMWVSPRTAGYAAGLVAPPEWKW